MAADVGLSGRVREVPAPQAAVAALDHQRYRRLRSMLVAVQADQRPVSVESFALPVLVGGAVSVDRLTGGEVKADHEEIARGHCRSLPGDGAAPRYAKGRPRAFMVWMGRVCRVRPATTSLRRLVIGASPIRFAAGIMPLRGDLS